MTRVRRLLIPGRFREWLRQSFWAVPFTFVALAIAFAVLTLAIDRGADTSFAFSGDAQSARSLLSTLASAMLSFTGLVFSITIVALQLSSSQWSPRVMRTFLRDRPSKVAMGTFVATFTYAFVVLRGVQDSFVPGVSLTAAIVLMLVSVAVFIRYIDHIAHGLRVASVIAAVGDEGREVIRRLLPSPDADPDPDPRVPVLSSGPDTVLCSGEPGVVLAFDEEGLVRRARSDDAVLVLRHGVGDFVPAGAPLIAVHGRADATRDSLDLVQLGRERTTQQDVAFSLRQLVDIVERALSPSVNDPTTAVQAIDRLHDLLREIGSRPIPDGRLQDSDGRTRLVVPALDWDGYVGLALDEVILHGAAQPTVRVRLGQLFDDLLDVVADDRRDPLVRRRRRLLELTPR